MAGQDPRFDIDHYQWAQAEEFLGQRLEARLVLVEVAGGRDVRAGVGAERLDLLQRVARSLVAAGHAGVGVDAVPELPPELGVTWEDGGVVAQRLSQENLLRTGRVPRIDPGVAVWDAARRVRLVSRARAPGRVHAEDEACYQRKSNGDKGRCTHLPTEPCLHGGFLSGRCG